MPDSDREKQKARRWSAFVCPDCRFVFRVPRDHDGHGIICPSCRRMLRIPEADENTAPLVAPIRKIGFAEDTMDRRKHRRPRSSPQRKSSVFGLIGMTLLVLLIIAAIAWFLRENQENDSAPYITHPQETQDDFDSLISPEGSE